MEIMLEGCNVEGNEATASMLEILNSVFEN